jgi:O-antigen ligase
MIRAIHLAFVAVVVLSPLPLGSNSEWSWSGVGLIVGVLLVASAIAEFAAPQGSLRLEQLKALAVPGVLLGLVLVWSAFQLTAWNPSSGEGPTGTIDPQQQAMSVLRLMTYVGVFLMAALQMESTARARRILGSIVVVATASTAYSMVAEAINIQARFSGVRLWVPERQHFSGTFVNANNYATYAGIAAVLAFVLALQPYGAKPPKTKRLRLRLVIMRLTGHGGVWTAFGLVLLAGVLLSSSRGGIVSTAFALTVFAMIYTRGIGRLVVVAMVLTIYTGAALILRRGEWLFERVSGFFEHGESGREALFSITLRAIELRPLTGWGMNRFEQLYGLFQPPTLAPTYDMAHNTYLELAFDLGIPAAAALLLTVAWLLARCIYGFQTRGRNRELVAAGLMASALIGVHALVDFSIQIPAVAYTYFAVLGVAWRQSWSSRS